MTFIGSSHVGWHLNRMVADGTRVALEHGGVAPVIVEKSASLETLIPSIVKGGFYHAGQVCVSVQNNPTHVYLSNIQHAMVNHNTLICNLRRNNKLIFSRGMTIPFI